jgi:hypothetical protein
LSNTSAGFEPPRSHLMNAFPEPGTPTATRWSRLGPWIWLGVAVCWIVAIRVPLIVNAAVHLDSDLAVDGLTLMQALQGRWRWHYPGTPHMGIAPVLLSWVQARLWGADALTLVSGGTVAYVLVLLTTFTLAWHLYGRAVAGWSLVPLCFASTGNLWLSGRITGGHLPVLAWSAAAWLLLHLVLVRPGLTRMALLGLWCGLGIYLDSMFLMTLAGMLCVGLAAGWLAVKEAGSKARAGAADDGPGRVSHGFSMALALVMGLSVGASPRLIGKLVDPYDAYADQFSWSLEPRLLAEHLRILSLECVPRLIAGHRVPGLEADPDPALLGSAAPLQRSAGGNTGFGWPALALTILALGGFIVAILSLAALARSSPDPSQRLITAGILTSSLLVLVGFLVNRNIFNSDNYRYLVVLLIPWSIGLGCALRRVSLVRGPGLKAASLFAIALAVLFTIDTIAWYRRLGWIDERCIPVRRRLDDAALAWLEERPDVRWIQGGYWDVYRLSFLTGGRVRGVPLPVFPDRFPGWSTECPGGRPEILVVRSSPEGQYFLKLALRQGGEILFRDKGLFIVLWPTPLPAPTAF